MQSSPTAQARWCLSLTLLLASIFTASSASALESATPQPRQAIKINRATPAGLHRGCPQTRIRGQKPGDQHCIGVDRDVAGDVHCGFGLAVAEAASAYTVELNLYSYAGNNPVAFVDPDGLDPIGFGDALGILFVDGGASLSDEKLEEYNNDSTAGNLTLAATFVGVGAGAAAIGLATAGEPLNSSETGSDDTYYPDKEEKKKAVDDYIDRRDREGLGKRGGEREGKNFTPKGMKEIDRRNADRHGGQNRCAACGVKTTPGKKSEKGVKPDRNEKQRDHIIPKDDGGAGVPENGDVFCRECNRGKSNR